MIPRLYLDPDATPNAAPRIEGTALRLSPEHSHHVVEVLRLSEGAPVTVFDGSGGEWQAVLSLAHRKAAQVRLEIHVAVEREARVAITLAQGLPQGDKMDWVIQKASELGAVAVQPLATARSLLKLDSERAAKRVAHWHNVAVAASEQCGRNRLLQIEPVARLTAWLVASAVQTSSVKLILDPQGALALTDVPAPATGAACLLVGPEAGFAPDEIALACANGFQAVRLSTRVLRTETAGLAAVAALLTAWRAW